MRTSFLLLFFFPFAVLGQKEISISPIPSDAEIYNLSLGGLPVKIGSGTISLRLEKEKPVTIEVKKEGYLPVRKTILRKKDGESKLIVELTDRVVQINASPADASIYVNSIDRGKSPQSFIIKKGESITVEIKKPGFVTQSKTYYNKEGQDIPEISSLFKLEDRLVSVKTNPQDALILIDDVKKGEGSAQIIIPKDKCVTVKVDKAGYVSNEVTYCNKESEPVPPFNDVINLRDRKAQINVIPEDAKIFVDGKEVAKGNYAVKIPFGKCTEILVVKPSFVTERYDLCNQTDAQAPEVVYSIKMKDDEAYQQSEESSIANKNFTLTIDNPNINQAEAWKKLVSIIQSRFDEIETIDASTNYLKTNWVGRTFNQGSQYPSMIRTRVIITSAGSANNFNIKIQSELSKPSADCSGAGSDFNKRRLTPTMDECFEPVDRILRKYSDLISEIQRRFN
jgi:hypothetical protein